MGNGHGGARSGAGRPRGSPDTVTRHPMWNRPKMDPNSRAAFVAFCKEVTESGRAALMLDEALSCDDPYRRDQALRLALSYSVGMPATHHTVSVVKGLDQLMLEMVEKREQKRLAATTVEVSAD